MLAAMTPRERLATAHLYLVCDARPRAWLEAAVRGGVDIVQLRDKSLDDEGLVAAAQEFRDLGALFILNDRPGLVEACGADGVHVGQDDMSPAEARAIVGPDRIVGRSTHAPDQADAAQADPDVDYLAIGPVWETPTKPGRPAAGLEYVEYAARTVTKPWFAIGGIDAANLSAVADRGARGIVVVRAIAEADDPEAAARELAEATAPADDRMRRGYARSRERDDAVRASLEPLKPGERPGAVTVAAVVSAVFGLLLVGQALFDGDADVKGLLVFAAVMFLAAAGMWKAQYWAVLGFEFFLGLTLVFAAVSLMFAGNALGVVYSLVILTGAGVLFWKLVRAMARIQMPKRG
jgi:thiamine-phosphate pyrophosphorylase